MKLLAPFIVLAVILVGSVLLDRPEPEADFTFVNRGEVFTLDPQRMSWMQDFRMAYALYEPLVRWKNNDFTIEPAVCTTMPEVSDDQLTYTFHLRPDAKWSNGAPVTAHDYIWSWMRALMPDTAADYSMMFFCIDGGREYFDWRQRQLTAFANEDVSETAIDLWARTEQQFTDTVGLRAIDDHTLEVRLAQSTPYFLDLVAFGVFHPVYRPCVEGWEVDDPVVASTIIERGWHAVEAPPFEQRDFATLNPDSGGYEQKHGWTKPGQLTCNGPYVLTQWRYKRGMRLERNPHYHSPTRAKSGSVSIVSIEDPNTAVLAFERGQIDWLSDVSTDYQADLIAQRLRYEEHHREKLDQLLASGLSIDEALAKLPEPGPDERRNIHVFPTFGTDFYSFNCRAELADGSPNPFHEPAVRRAFVAAVDRSAITTHVTRLNEPVRTTFIPVDAIPGYTSPTGIGYDIEYAKAQLAEAGWLDRDGDGLIENGSGQPFPIVDLLYSTNGTRYKNISLALRDMWQQTLGVQVELRPKENKTFKEDLKSGNFMIGRGRWYGDYGDPTTFLDLFHTDDGNNDRGYSNEMIDQLLTRAATEIDPVKRMAIFSEIERYLFQEDPPMLILCQLVQLYMYEPGEVRGLSQHPRLTQYLWQVGVDER